MVIIVCVSVYVSGDHYFLSHSRGFCHCLFVAYHPFPLLSLLWLLCLCGAVKGRKRVCVCVCVCSCLYRSLLLCMFMFIFLLCVCMFVCHYVSVLVSKFELVISFSLIRSFPAFLVIILTGFSNQIFHIFKTRNLSKPLLSLGYHVLH